MLMKQRNLQKLNDMHTVPFSQHFINWKQEEIARIVWKIKYSFILNQAQTLAMTDSDTHINLW